MHARVRDAASHLEEADAARLARADEEEQLERVHPQMAPAKQACGEARASAAEASAGGIWREAVSASIVLVGGQERRKLFALSRWRSLARSLPWDWV